MHNDLILPGDDATRTAWLDEAMACADAHMSVWHKRGRSPVTDAQQDAVLDAAVRATLTRHHCGPVFPGLGAFIDALDDDTSRPPHDDEEDDDADEDAHAIHLLRAQGEAR
jgi:hypothetical protein